MRTKEEQIKDMTGSKITQTIMPWPKPDPFVLNFANCGTISLYKDGRVVSNFKKADEAAKAFLTFVEQYYNEHILEAERRAEQRVRDEIGKDSERLDWLLARTYYGIPGFDPHVRDRNPENRKTDLIQAIDTAMEAE